MSDSSVTIDGTDIAGASMDGVGVLDEAAYVYANEELTSLHGYAVAEELVDREWDSLYTPDDAQLTATEVFDRVREDGSWRGAARALRADGSEVPVELAIHACDDGMVCVVREQTETNGSGQQRRRTRNQTQAGTQKQGDAVGFSKNLLDTLDDVIYVVDRENDVVAWNERLNDRLGYTDEEIAEMSLLDFLPEEYHDLLGEHGDRMVDFPERRREMDVVTKAGERIPHELRGVTYTDEATGDRYRVGIAREITERKQREAELERYETIFETIDDGVYALNEDFEIELANDRLVEMLGRFGHSRAEVLGSDAHELLLHDDERAAVETIRERVLAGDRDAGSFEARAETDDGDPTVLESRFRLQPASDGEYRGCIGIVRDITERKQREEALRSARQFNEELVENAPFGMFRLDDDLRITYENPRAEEIIGLPDDEESSAAIGEDIRDLPSIVATGKADLFTRLTDGETIEFEFPFESIYGREAYFTGRGVPLYRNGEFDGAVVMANDISERRRQEQELERQRDELDTLNRINELLLAVSRDLYESPVEGAIEQTVCDRLADSDLYRFAWVGKPEVGGNRLVPDASAGIGDDYLESITVTTDEGDTGDGPGGRAYRTGTMQVSQDIETDPTFEPWCETALDNDIRSAAAVPLTYAGTTYGILGVYAARPLAFSRRERRGFEILGEAIGYAINATRTRELLFAEKVVELELRVTDTDEFVIGAADRLGCRLSLEGCLSTGDELWLLYVSVRDGDPTRLVERARGASAVETVRTLGSKEEPVVALTTHSSLLNTIAAVGGRLAAGSIDRGRGNFVVELPQSTDITERIEQLRSVYPDTEILAKRDRERSVEESPWVSAESSAVLTERQRQALEAAYRAGYFEWPRENSADDVAELLDISRPTLHAHLRKAVGALLSEFFEGNRERS